MEKHAVGALHPVFLDLLDKSASLKYSDIQVTVVDAAPQPPAPPLQLASPVKREAKKSQQHEPRTTTAERKRALKWARRVKMAFQQRHKHDIVTTQHFKTVLGRSFSENTPQRERRLLFLELCRTLGVDISDRLAEYILY